MMFWQTQSTNPTKDGAKDSQNSAKPEMRKNRGDQHQRSQIRQLKAI
jgi:hypothetical protein